MAVNNQTTSDHILFTVEDHHVAGLLLIVTAFFGACANYIIVFLTDKISSLQNAFGCLTRNQAIGEAILLTIFTLCFGPMILFNIDFFKSDSVARVFGHINLVCYDICIYSHLIISMNRFTAIYFPFHYNEIFSKRYVLAMIFGIYFTAIAPSLYMYIYEDCHLIYQEPFWKFNFISTPACITIMYYWDFWRYVSTVSLIALLDVLAFAKARISSVKVNITDAVARKRRHDEIKFVKQVCLQGLVFVCELLTYFILPRYFESRWAIYLLTTFAWALVHACDGYITLFFNKEFFRLLKAILSSKSQYSASTLDQMKPTSTLQSYTSANTEHHSVHLEGNKQ
ncbi:unnamed protein product, partial [Mesorhabditis belari]|uniref:G-protein coupled receptors family 1 profile domain-containing protein n=1 Tax=Mesorhabditis belari TaxID=2138241 RepID=A0AAF3FNX2_9BILA